MTAGPVRSGPLSHAQHLFWLEEFRGAGCGWANVIIDIGIPPGARQEDVLDTVNVLVERHEALRTCFLADEPVQVVHAPRPVAVELIHVEDSREIPAAAARACADAGWHLIDLARNFPLRARLIVAGSTPARLIITANHVAMDGVSMEILREEFGTLLRGRADGSPAGPPPVTDQPIDLALRERSPEGRRANADALLWWEEHFAGMPNAAFRPAGPGVDETGQLYEIVMESPGIAAAVQHLELRGLRAGDTLLTAFGALLATRTGRHRLPFLTVSANRADDSVRRTVGSLAQQVPVAVDLSGDPSFSGLVRRTRPAIVTAYSCGTYDFAEMKARERRHALRRGVHIAPLPVFNFFSGAPAGGSGASPPSPPQAPPCLPPDGSGISPLRVAPVSSGRHDCFVFQVDPRPPAATVTLYCNAATRAAGEHLASAFEALMIRAATDPSLPVTELAAKCGIQPDAPEPGWAMVDNCWVNPGQVARLLCAHPGVAAADAFAVTDAAGRTSLVAFVTAAPGGRPDPFSLRRLVIDALPRHPLALAPHHFVICDGMPAPPRDLAAWRGQTVLASGSGTAAPP
ncbi:MAG TPA: condensation domain-containing protein [Streptosporangiaceae bacterium]